MRLALLSLALLASAAEASPDRRIRHVSYSPDQVVSVVGRAGIQSTIEFAADERIENVAVGNSAVWQITPNRRASLLFVKPLVGARRTNMTVVTNLRTYLFDLVPAVRRGTTAMYAIRFDYADATAVDAAAVSAPKLPSPLSLADTVAAVASAEPSMLNYAWTARGAPELVPARIYDDGQALFLSWPNDRVLPAILAVGADGKSEEPVEYQANGGYVVIKSPPSLLHLRLGGRLVTVNRADKPAAKGRKNTPRAIKPSPALPEASVPAPPSTPGGPVVVAQIADGVVHGR